MNENMDIDKAKTIYLADSMTNVNEINIMSQPIGDLEDDNGYK